MSAPRIDLSIDQGSTFKKSFVLVGSDGGPINMETATADMQLRNFSADLNVAAELTTTNSSITLGATNGTIELLLTSTVTAGLTAGSYVYDLEVTLGSGEVFKVCRGNVTIVREITR